MGLTYLVIDIHFPQLYVTHLLSDNLWLLGLFRGGIDMTHGNTDFSIEM